ncbi:PEP/pyruvate-binding domain-containing protein [Neolewinella agarilytica]|uniref:PEP/pyruvate-binding domain-containing protein n=1 Tax=Neolewinella agarilytica TaxID=478744 RepID=UPI002355E372|nr:PEP/pyruvate-binding domain-containing protein [Neolewinella agarilytica]
MLRLLVVFVLFLALIPEISAQTTDERLRELVNEYRADPRGPYRGIFWFCADGTQNAPREPCEEQSEDNHQHADYKSDVKSLMVRDHLYWGQILTNTDRASFWDEAKDQSRLKQYQLGNYLAAVDNGWVLEKARFYRGAFQIEDEENWGRDFFLWLMRKPGLLKTDYYLLLQAARDIPHRGDTDLNQRIRAVSKNIADAYPDFMDLRIKIHGSPALEDAAAVRSFAETNKKELDTKGLTKDAEQLVADIEAAYGGSGLENIRDLTAGLADGVMKRMLEQFIFHHEAEGHNQARLTAATEVSLQLREAMTQDTELSARDKLAMIDLQNELSDLIFRSAGSWKPASPRELMEKICYLGKAAAGAGLVELWEYEDAESQLADQNYQYIFPASLNEYIDNARRFVEWGTATNRAVYVDVVERYAAFEPKALGFLDDRIRSSVLLPLGEAVGSLGGWLADHSEQGNALMDLRNQAQARGLNPGFAKGKLRLIEGTPDEVEVNPNDIFVFSRPPADLKPVGGILTVSEGNMVSHVQLLARNLGIPNAVLTDDQFSELKSYDGEEVFYAVSNAGTVLMKPAGDMSDVEQELFAVRERNLERIRVPVDRIDLSTKSVLNMRNVNSTDSGVRCGPKAANLGQLKQLFPEKVVEGLVIPFGIFREHLNQRMPGQGDLSYWEFLNRGFADAKKMEEKGFSEAEIETFTLERLATLRAAIAQIELYPSLINELRAGFSKVLGGPLGSVPVFLRSDTNMEDLEDFTGAGLNKTVFNVVDEAGIIDGIKAVWASPYTERSYRWRQRYLLNPENVFPSILIIPTVDVDHSGVMITKGVTSGHPDDITVAFSRGAGGAVDGQAAESYLLDHLGRFTLLAPARERLHRRLPKTGGSVMVPAAFDERILSRKNLKDLYELGQEVERVMPASDGVETDGPFDVELGFADDKIWLFQIRPFVENKNAMSSEYLESISPAKREGVWIDLGVSL